MANTISTSLILDILSNRVVTTLGNKIASFKAFSRDFSTEVLRQNANVQIPKATAGSSTLTDPSSYESGNSTLSNIAVMVNAYSQPFTLTSQALNQGFRIEMLADKNLQNLANKLTDIAFTPVTSANFSTVTVAQASFGTANLKTLWANNAKSDVRNLLLDATAMSQLLPQNTFGFTIAQGQPGFGFDALYTHTRWTGANANAYGFGCGPEAIAIAAGIPEVAPAVASLIAEQRVVEVPGVGLPVQINLWGSTSSRSLWCSFDVMFGAALGDNTAGTVVVTA